MEKERIRDLKRSGGGRLTKRQKRAVSGHTIINISPTSLTSLSYVINHYRGGDEMERLKKERGRGLRWSSGNDEEDSGPSGGSEHGDEEASIFRSPPTATTAASLSSKKTVRLQGKVLEDCNAADLAVVPRKSRSDPKRKQHRAPNGTQLAVVNGAGRLEQSMLIEFTKDEKEVAEILASLPSLFAAYKPSRVLEEIVVTKKTSISLSEASKEGATRFLLACTGTEATNPSSCVEQPPGGIVKAVEPSVKEQPISISGSPKSDIESNGTAQPDLKGPLTSKHEPAKNTSSGGAVKSSNPLGDTLHRYIENGVSDPIQIDDCHPQKQDIYSQNGPASRKQEFQSVKQNPDGGSHSIPHEETIPDAVFRMTGRVDSTTSSSTKATLWPYTATGARKPSSTGNYLPAQKHTPVSADRKSSWRRCETHVYISHRIQNIQKELNSGVQTLGEPVGSRNNPNSASTSGANGHIAETNTHESRNRYGCYPQQKLRDYFSLSASGETSNNGNGIESSYGQHHYASLLQPHSQQKLYDYFSSSGSGETSNTGNGLESSSGQHHVPCLQQSQGPPHHSMVSLPSTLGRYTSYPGHTAVAATKQVQMELPHYRGGGSQFYGQQHMVHATTEQQQMLQAHRTQVVNIKMNMTNGKQLEILPSPQPPSVSATPPHSEMLGGAATYRLSNNLQQQQSPAIQLLPSSSSRAKKPRHHHESPPTTIMATPKIMEPSAILN